MLEFVSLICSFVAAQVEFAQQVWGFAHGRALDLIDVVGDGL